MIDWITKLEDGKEYGIPSSKSELYRYLIYCFKMSRIKNVPIPKDCNRVLSEFKHDVKKLLVSTKKEIDEMPGHSDYDEEIKNKLLLMFRLDKFTRLIQRIEKELGE